MKSATKLLGFLFLELLLHNSYAKQVFDSKPRQTKNMLLPRIEVQFICGYDIRSTFNVTNTFDDLYRILVPNLNKVHLATELKMSSMRDIPTAKWYYPQCNMTSHQVLTTLEVEAFVEFDIETNRTNVDHLFGEETVEDYFQENVCSDMDLFKVFYDKPKNPMPATFENVDHNLLLLCGGADIVYYDNDAPDPVFLLLAFFLGFIMVGQIFGELHQYDRRPHPLGRRNSTRHNTDTGLTSPNEIEMV
jgi:hypothetical protein